MLFNTQNYGGGLLQFTNSRGKPAPIDVRTKSVEAIFDAPDQQLVTIVDIVPVGDPMTGPDMGKFQFTCTTIDEAAGGFSGKFRADRDMTEAGEDILEVPFAEVVGPEGATGAAVSFGRGTDK